MDISKKSSINHSKSIERYIEKINKANNLTLEEKAIFYGEDIEDLHLTQDNLIKYRIDAASGEMNSKGDTGYHMGFYLSSLVYKYSVHKDDTTKNKIIRMVGAIHELHKITGIPGLFARHFEKNQKKTTESFFTSPTKEGYVYLGYVSCDQLIPIIDSYYNTVSLVNDNRLNEIIKQDVSALLDHYILNDFKLIEQNGKACKYGKLSNRFNPIQNLFALYLFRTGYEITKDKKYLEVYSDLIKKNYHKHVKYAKFKLFNLERHFNDPLLFEAIYRLIKLESDKNISKEYYKFLEKIWSESSGEKNSFFIFMYNDIKRNNIERKDALESLVLMPLNKIGYCKLNSKDPNINTELVLTLGGFEYFTKEPLPMNQRPVSDSFMWSENPRQADYCREISKFTGIDYMIAYWFARSKNLIP